VAFCFQANTWGNSLQSLLICHITFNQPPLIRRERANVVSEVNSPVRWRQRAANPEGLTGD